MTDKQDLKSLSHQTVKELCYIFDIRILFLFHNLVVKIPRCNYFKGILELQAELFQAECYHHQSIVDHFPTSHHQLFGGNLGPCLPAGPRCYYTTTLFMERVRKEGGIYQYGQGIGGFA